MRGLLVKGTYVFLPKTYRMRHYKHQKRLTVSKKYHLFLLMSRKGTEIGYALKDSLLGN